MGLEKFLILFPLLVLVLGWVQPSLGGKPPYLKFHSQHMDPGGLQNRSPTYCNTMMKRRGMTKMGCKHMNTFVHQSPANVKAVCSQKKVKCKTGRNNCYKSRSTMHITDCQLKGGSKYPNCNYKTSRYQKHIIVACAGNPYVPVHFYASV